MEIGLERRLAGSAFDLRQTALVDPGNAGKVARDNLQGLTPLAQEGAKVLGVPDDQGWLPDLHYCQALGKCGWRSSVLVVVPRADRNHAIRAKSR